MKDPKEDKLTLQELLDAGIELAPEELSSDIIYVDKNGNEIDEQVDGE